VRSVLVFGDVKDIPEQISALLFSPTVMALVIWNSKQSLVQQFAK
jgi:hypothetical protein